MSKISLQAAIAALPTGSSGEVFNFLLERQIMGRRKEPCGCPIAVYLRGELGQMVSVATTRAHVDDLDEGLSESVQTFIVNFDLGRFPELDIDQQRR